ncbi:MAG: HEAT repeat domain-containing protein [Sandaracinaceae bacterium]
MALFGLFGKGKAAIPKHAKRVGNKRAQAPDRWESIQVLGQVGCGELEAKGGDQREEAIGALMARFTFTVDPSITDGEEKDEAFRWIARAGAAAVAPVRRALRQHDSPSWPLRILGELVPEPQLTQEMLAVLAEMDTEYERDPQKKLVILSSLEEARHPDIAAAVVPFFQDVNETARFHAMGAALAQDNGESVRDELLAALAEEDSLRVKARALEGLARRGWSLGVARAAVEADLPPGYRIDSEGVPQQASAAASTAASAAPTSRRVAPKRKKRR